MCPKRQKKNLSLIDISNEYYLVAFLATLLSLKFEHQHHFGNWSLSWPPTIFVAPFEKQPHIQSNQVQKTDSLEQK